MKLLKQSTAVTLLLGPFVDSTDGITAETALSLTQADIRLWKEGGTTAAQKGDATTCTHRELGYYTCPLSTTDTNTLGILTVFVAESGAMPVRHDYQIVPAQIYNSLVLGSDLLYVDAREWIGVTIANALQTAANVRTEMDTNSTQLAKLGTPAGASLAADLVSIKGDTDGIDAIAAAITALNNLSAAGVRTAVGLATANLDTQLAALSTALTGNRGEPGQGALAASTSLLLKVDYLYKFLRNKKEVTATTEKVFNDAGNVVDQKRALSVVDDVLTVAEVATGP